MVGQGRPANGVKPSRSAGVATLGVLVRNGLARQCQGDAPQLSREATRVDAVCRHHGLDQRVGENFRQSHRLILAAEVGQLGYCVHVFTTEVHHFGTVR